MSCEGRVSLSERAQFCVALSQLATFVVSGTRSSAGKGRQEGTIHHPEDNPIRVIAGIAAYGRYRLGDQSCGKLVFIN